VLSNAPVDAPLVTVIVPVRDEARFLPACLASLLAQDWPRDRLEILVVDGLSCDGTDVLARNLALDASNVRVLVNPRLTAAAALNVGIREARGEVIARLDGHAEAAPDFVRRSVEALAATGADAVGGPIETVGDGPTGRAIAAAMTSRFGTGGAAFRTGRGGARDVDTVAFPAWRRDVFERFGLFDERFVRNQDDEFHLRVRRGGGRIAFVPDIRTRYWGRSCLGALARQYFGYGLWKVAVLRKHGRLPTARALAPAALVAGLAASAVVAAATGDARWLLAVAGPYVVATLIASVLVAARRGWSLLPRLPFAFATLHSAYGVGLAAGAARRFGVPASAGSCPSGTTRQSNDPPEGGTPNLRIEHVRRSYAARPARPRDAALIEARRHAVRELLATERVSLAGKLALDLGCGRGDSLADVPGATTFGIDLLPERLALARTASPAARLAAADAALLPFRDESFDACILSTVLSSILDRSLRRRVAAEAVRVLRPGGVVLVHDFAFRPGNRDVRGVPARTLARLFPRRRVVVRRTRGPYALVPSHYVALVLPA
jgi:succinoglycan biosynthesis protein ExoA